MILGIVASAYLLIGGCMWMLAEKWSREADGDDFQPIGVLGSARMVIMWPLPILLATLYWIQWRINR